MRKTTSKFAPEVRDCAVRMVVDRGEDRPRSVETARLWAWPIVPCERC